MTLMVMENNNQMGNMVKHQDEKEKLLQSMVRHLKMRFKIIITTTTTLNEFSQKTISSSHSSKILIQHFRMLVSLQITTLSILITKIISMVPIIGITIQLQVMSPTIITLVFGITTRATVKSLHSPLNPRPNKVTVV